jgi:hypothetical protein
MWSNLLISTNLANHDAIRAEFKAITPPNVAAYRAWRCKYCDISLSSLAQIVKIRLTDIHAAMGTGTPRRRDQQSNRIPDADVPADALYNPDWLRQTIEHCSVGELARKVGRSKCRVKQILKKHGIAERRYRRRAPNVCYTKAWCHKHYCVLKWPTRKCAEAAGVSQTRFVQWLCKFSIPLRRACAIKGDHTAIWHGQLCYRLQQCATVVAAKAAGPKVTVRYRDGFTERYFFDGQPKPSGFDFRLTESRARLESLPTLHHEYEENLDGTKPYGIHVYYKRDEFAQHSLIEQRVALHHMATVIKSAWTGLIPYPEAVLADWWAKVQVQLAATPIPKGDTILLQQQKQYAQLILGHFDFGRINWMFTKQCPIFKLMADMAAERWGNLGFEEFMWHVTSRRMFKHRFLKPRGFRNLALNRVIIADPQIYAPLFRQLPTHSTILDLAPNTGGASMAAAFCGHRYMATPDRAFAGALARGWDKRLGLEFVPDDQVTPVDLVVWSQYTPAGLSYRFLQRHAARSKRIAVYLHGDDFEINLGTPQVTYKVGHHGQTNFDRLLIY